MNQQLKNLLDTLELTKRHIDELLLMLSNMEESGMEEYRIFDLTQEEYVSKLHYKSFLELEIKRMKDERGIFSI